jgi:formylglycine-generating enzyme required for sulfatase activity
MHGNVSEWVLDQHDPKFYQQFAGDKLSAFPKTYNVPSKIYGRVVRGGSWDDDPEGLRSAARFASTPDWKIQDPQIPQSIWYLTDALHVGFRVVRTPNAPTEEERQKLQLEPIPVDLVKK